MRLIALILLISAPSTTFAQKMGKDVELNLFIMSQHYANPDSLNGYVTEFNSNAGTTKEISKISQISFQAAEILGVTANDMGYGIRYSSMSTSGSGRQSGTDVDLSTALTDISGVIKFMTAANKFQSGAGLSVGVSSAFSVTIKNGSTSTIYQPTSQIVARGFLLGRLNFGRFALHGEGGYLLAKAPELKNDNLKLTKADGSNVELDLSGAYISAGIGWQF